MKTALISSRILTEGGWTSGVIVIEDGVITAIEKEAPKDAQIIDYKNNMILPGIIDIHNHGYGGWSMTEPAEVKDIQGFAKAMSTGGVTTVLPTAREAAFEAIAETMETEYLGARIYGIYSEGPFWARGGENTVNESWPMPTVEETERLLSVAKGKIKIMGIAPELPGAYDVIRYLHSKGVLVASAHTKAKSEQIADAMKTVGLDSVTHLCNGMQGIHHRNVGALGAYLLEENLYYELIADCNHTCPEMLKLCFKCQPYEKFMLISDSCNLSGLPLGKYMRYGRQMETLESGYILDINGRIMGCARNVLFTMKQLVDKVGVSLENASRMASLIPARFLGIDRQYGSIRPGKVADIFVMDDDFNCLKTYVNGSVVFDSEVETPESTYNMETAIKLRIE